MTEFEEIELVLGQCIEVFNKNDVELEEVSIIGCKC